MLLLLLKLRYEARVEVDGDRGQRTSAGYRKHGRFTGRSCLLLLRLHCGSGSSSRRGRGLLKAVCILCPGADVLLERRHVPRGLRQAVIGIRERRGRRRPVQSHPLVHIRRALHVRVAGRDAAPPRGAAVPVRAGVPAVDALTCADPGPARSRPAHASVFDSVSCSPASRCGLAPTF